MRLAILVTGLLTAAAAGQVHREPSQAVLTEARKSVTATLKDPVAAQFRKVRKAPDADRARVCGEVNAKNAYGGYVGFQKFVYFPDTKESEILDEDFPSVSYVQEKAKLFGSCFR